jgi:hypothetical protein
MRVKNEERISQKLTNWAMSPPSSLPNWAVGFRFLGEVFFTGHGGSLLGAVKKKKTLGSTLKLEISLYPPLPMTTPHEDDTLTHPEAPPLPETPSLLSQSYASSFRMCLAVMLVQKTSLLPHFLFSCSLFSLLVHCH